ncbi:MAG: zinc-ribbon domain-containing protein, partial [Myxococcales bacterium]|nr:zinc-ribbon domain-containing protein [Myxococcales bacterium]
MNITCPSCKARYAVDDARIPPTGATIRCPSCHHTFVAHHSVSGPAPFTPPTAHLADETPLSAYIPPASAVPLPGGTTPSGASPPAPVPLPGNQPLMPSLSTDSRPTQPGGEVHGGPSEPPPVLLPGQTAGSHAAGAFALPPIEAHNQRPTAISPHPSSPTTTRDLGDLHLGFEGDNGSNGLNPDAFNPDELNFIEELNSDALNSDALNSDALNSDA